MTTSNLKAYSEQVLPHLNDLIPRNQAVLDQVVQRLVSDVQVGKSLFIFGSGHSAIFPMELYHRAGGASFIVPVIGDCLLPTAGPPLVRVLERTVGVSIPFLKRAQPRSGEMIWIASQSGINSAAIDIALEAKQMGLFTVAFTSLIHSQAVKSRHPSQKKLFEVCDLTVDLHGRVGDACVPIDSTSPLTAGPLSTLGSLYLGHSILVAAVTQLESQGVPCVYTSVNTPEGEARNHAIEKTAMQRDPLLRF